jgi:hypothetical protein
MTAMRHEDPTIPSVSVVPVELRPAITDQLRLLTNGELPSLMTWVNRYGRSGTSLIAQPEEIWTDERTDVVEADDGGWFLTLPLWTVDEAPSDLSAEVRVSAEGAAQITDVHVL